MVFSARVTCLSSTTELVDEACDIVGGIDENLTCLRLERLAAAAFLSFFLSGLDFLTMVLTNLGKEGFGILSILFGLVARVISKGGFSEVEGAVVDKAGAGGVRAGDRAGVS